ncbi:unnamed protein product [Protopolystoma xenopodis]|uniref:T-box domain-containing protein n=1 Tax=Protopolystoma xenopodis TaxID=117903 RepID=A0A3S5A321_9PLAT|nr:unnamed protein product [Protopolystoma xenopodis]
MHQQQTPLHSSQATSIPLHPASHHPTSLSPTAAYQTSGDRRITQSPGSDALQSPSSNGGRHVTATAQSSPSSAGGYRTPSGRIPTCVTGQPGMSDSEAGQHDNPCVELVDKSLWDKFHTHGTEMVITKSGRKNWLEGIRDMVSPETEVGLPHREDCGIVRRSHRRIVLRP